MKKRFFFIVCVVAVSPVWGYNLRQVSKYDGLSNSAIQTICQDSDGLMWFGSVDGLNSYDGRTLRTLHNSNVEALSGNLIEDMIEAGPGIFWIQTNYGLDRLDKRRRTVERFGEYCSNYRLRKGGDVKLLFVRETGEIVYWNEVREMFCTLAIEGVDSAMLLDYLVTGDNTLWLLRRGGQSAAYSVVCDAGGDCTLVPVTAFEHSLPLQFAFHEGEAIYFVDSAGTLYEYDTRGRKKYYVADIGDEIDRRGDISSIVRSGGDYFVGFKTDGLISLRHVSDSAQQYRVEQIDVRAGVFCLLHDRRQDVVWIGTDGQGVYIYSDDSYSVRSTFFESFTRSINKPTRAIFLDGEGSLWVATKGDGLFRLRDYDFNRSAAQHAIDYFNTRNSRLSDNSVYSLSGSEQGVMWIGTDDGVDWFDYTTGTIRPLGVEIDGEPLRWVHGVVQLDSRTLWIATVGEGMVRVDLGWSGRTPCAVGAERFTTGDGSMSANYFFTVYGGSPGSVWFGNRGYGAYRRDVSTGEFESVRFDDSEAGRTLNDIFCIMQNAGGEMWFGTSAGLVKRTADGRTTVYNERSGFHNSTIHGMLTDSGGVIWLSTNYGIIRFDPATETFVAYSHNAPTDVIEFSDGAFFRSAERETLFFGGINGFTAIRENRHAATRYVPPLMFDRLTIFGEEKNVYDYLFEKGGRYPELRLGYRENFFSLSLVAVDYIDGHNYTYKYRLEGVNDAWIDNGTGNTVYFTNIAPGSYTLRMKGFNPATGVETDEFVLGIRIRPAWYMSAVMCVVYFLLAAGVLWLVVRYFVRRGELRRKAVIERMKDQHQKEIYESKLSFFTNIIHEFCTPLTLIHGPCDHILSLRGTDPLVRRYTEMIRRNADRMNNLIQDLFDEALDPAPGEDVFAPGSSVAAGSGSLVQGVVADVPMPVYLPDERKPTVMIVDNERDILLFLSDIFAAEYNVIPLDNPSRVAAVLEQVTPNVVICDVMMPGIDGLSVTRQLRGNPKTAHIPLILVSTKHHVEEQIEGLEAGADLYITKPFNINYLKTSVRSLVARKDTFKEYFASPISAYELSGGHLTHVDHRRFVQQILDIITAELGNRDLSASLIADRMNMSTRQLYRNIHKAGAENPLHMIRECRLHVALDLLQNTTMTVDEIIYKSGFPNRAPFFVAFSEKFGCTPREYRHRHMSIK